MKFDYLPDKEQEKYTAATREIAKAFINNEIQKERDLELKKREILSCPLSIL